jgi:predicted RND superfamily exporter protein
MSADLKFLIPLVVIVVLAVLFLSFRRIGGIVLPILTVVVSSVWSIGAMAFLGVRLSIISTVLPVILVAVGSAYGIHVISHYYDETAGRRNLSREEHSGIIFAVLRKIGRPVLLAALTTFAGFISLCFTPVVPIYEFGIFASFGVVVAFLISVTLIPALLIIRGPAKSAGNSGGADVQMEDDPLSRALADGLMAASRKRRSTLLAAAAAVVVSSLGVSRLVIDNVMVEYFKPDSDVVQSDEYIRKYFGGSKTVSVVVTGEKPGDVLDPALLGAMDGLSAFLEKRVPEVGKTMAFTDLVKRINQVFNVDEAPEGLSPRAVPADAGGAEPAGETAFGFGSPDSAGEAAFGFGAPESAETAFGFGSFGGETAAPAPVGEAPRKSAHPLDADALVALLAGAVAENGGAGMDAAALVAAVKRSVNYQGAAYYEVPTDPARYGKADAAGLKDLVSGYLVLLSGDIDSYADDPLEPKSIRMSVQLRTLGQRDTDRRLRRSADTRHGYFPRT